jgi:tetratricopeptide (TPR) repeat protein
MDLPSTNCSYDMKKVESRYRHSENDLNSWGYELLQQGHLEKALAVFKLNVLLNPSSANVYDSYGEALLKAGDKKDAIRMYQKSIELNPKNEHGKKVLQEIKE